MCTHGLQNTLLHTCTQTHSNPQYLRLLAKPPSGNWKSVELRTQTQLYLMKRMLWVKSRVIRSLKMKTISGEEMLTCRCRMGGGVRETLCFGVNCWSCTECWKNEYWCRPTDAWNYIQDAFLIHLSDISVSDISVLISLFKEEMFQWSCVKSTRKFSPKTGSTREPFC